MADTEITRAQWRRIMKTEPWQLSTRLMADDLPAAKITRSQAIQFCDCCFPLPGDRIMGVTRREGLVVHAVFCPLLEEFEDELERWQDLTWHGDAAKTADNVARIILTLANEPGALGEVCTLIGEQRSA